MLNLNDSNVLQIKRKMMKKRYLKNPANPPMHSSLYNKDKTIPTQRRVKYFHPNHKNKKKLYKTPQYKFGEGFIPV